MSGVRGGDTDGRLKNKEKTHQVWCAHILEKEKEKYLCIAVNMVRVALNLGFPRIFHVAHGLEALLRVGWGAAAGVGLTAGARGKVLELHWMPTQTDGTKSGKEKR